MGKFCMTELVKIIAIAIISVIAILILKQVRPEFSLLIGLASGLCITFIILDALQSSLTTFTSILNKTGVNISLIKVVLKIIGLGYLTEFAANLCVDSGISSLSDKILLSGKLIILVEILPIISNLIELLLDIIK